LVNIDSGVNSRDSLLSVYKYTKGLKWTNRIEIHQIWFDKGQKKGVVHFTQHIQPFLFPYLNVTMKTIALYDFCLTKDGKWLIERLEENIPNEDLLNVVIPHSRPFLNYFKALGGVACVCVGKAFEKVGWS